MPPTSAFGWLCVAHSVADVVFRAAQIRSAQAIPRSSVSPDVASETRGLVGLYNVDESDTSTSPASLFGAQVTEKTDGTSSPDVSIVHEEPDPRSQQILTPFHGNIPSSSFVNATGDEVSTLYFCSVLEQLVSESNSIFHPVNRNFVYTSTRQPQDG